MIFLCPKTALESKARVIEKVERTQILFSQGTYLKNIVIRRVMITI